MRSLVLAVLATAPLTLFPSNLARGEDRLPLKALNDVPLSGRPNRLDYQSFDEKTHLLFIAHLGDGVVHVFDTEKGSIVADIPDVDAVHGVLVVPELGRCYASATGRNEIVSIDEKTLKVTDRIHGGDYPDGMAYDPVTKKLYVSDENGKTETVIDTKTQKRVATIELGGEVGNSQYDSVSKHVFVNIQTTNELVEIDPAKDAIVSRTTVDGDGNHGMFIDSGRRLAFLACQGDSKLVVLDLDSKKQKASFSIGRGNDVLAFDAGLRWLYVSSESGTVSIFEVGSASDPKSQEVKKFGEGHLAANAHTVAVDPTTHRVYFALKSVKGKPVLRVYEPVTGKKDADGDDDEGADDEVGSQLDQLQAKAVKEIQAKEYDLAVADLEKVLELAGKSDDLDESARTQHRQIAHYNLACALSLASKKAAAIEHFAKAVELGYQDWKQIDEDSDLDNIRGEEGFKKIVAKSKSGEEKKSDDF
jgi:DNA-binding beta-propeller fold protein YncE